MHDDALEEFRQAPAGWALEQELEVAAEVYGAEPKGPRTPAAELSDEQLLERYKSLMGFDLKWEVVRDPVPNDPMPNDPMPNDPDSH